MFRHCHVICFSNCMLLSVVSRQLSVQLLKKMFCASRGKCYTTFVEISSEDLVQSVTS